MGDVLSLEALPARKGDCLILYFGDRDAPRIAVIDGGPSRVYRKFLKPRLKDIRVDRGIADDQPLPIDLMVVSHLDDDHIKGILKLVEAEAEIVAGGVKPRFVDVHRLWHNSFDDVLGNAASEMPQVLVAMKQWAAGEDRDDLGEILEDSPEDDAVLASIGQGRNLRNMIRPLVGEGMQVNSPFRPEDLIQMTGTDTDVVSMFGDELKITIIGPMRAEVDRLQREYDRYLEKKNLGVPAAEAFLASFSKDTSVTNLSSIVMLCAAGGKSVFLTGDARGDKILNGLEERGLLTDGVSMHVDVLKVQHHGSPRSSEREFFERVMADHYVFSGNGDHGNPHPATLDMIAAARNGAPMTFHFTYPIEDIDAKSEDYAESRDHHWSREENSLAHWIGQNAAQGSGIEINASDSRAGIRIDLLEKVEIEAQ